MPSINVPANLGTHTNISVPRQVEISIPNTKRWRSAFVVISCTKAFRDVLTSRDNGKKISPSGSSDRVVVVQIDKELYDIDRPTLAKLVREKNLEKLDEFGGVQGLASAINSNVLDGINGDDAEDVSRRVDAFGKSTYHKPPTKSFFHFVWEAFRDPAITIPLACAALSLGFGIKKHGPKEGWYDGGSIFVAVFHVILVSAISNFRQSRQFDKLSKVSNNITIEVMRNGRRQQLSIFDIVVGDVVFLKIGDQVPADGLFLDGHSLRIDESSMTGDQSDHVEINHSHNPFLISGTKVADGYGQMLVTSVGMNTTWGEMMSPVSRDSNEKTRLQERLNKLTSTMQIVGSVLALVAAVVCNLAWNKKNQGGPKKLSSFNVLVEFIASVMSAAVATIPEGLPAAAAVAISYSLRKIMATKVKVRGLSACETMNSVTTICTEKSGILNQRKMAVTKFWLGKESVGRGNYTSLIPSSVLDSLHQAVSLNWSTSFLGEKEAFSVNSIDKAILSWAVGEQNMEMERMKQNYSILQVEEFSPEKRRRGVLVKKIMDDSVHLHWKGAAETILEMCSHYYDRDGDKRVLEDFDRLEFTQMMEDVGASSLRCIAFAHKQILEANYNDGEIQRELPENNLILLGIVGLKDPCKEAVRDCQDAGANIKMFTGDNILGAKAVATECGILRFNHKVDNGSVVEGAEFRNYTDDERMEKVDKIVVLAGSSPSDTELMVKCLKRKGHVVAVTGDGKNTSPALREADIALLTGIHGTKITKESRNTIILDDDNFSSIVRVLRWGRCMYSNIQKFTQFQLTANISGLVINFVTAVSTGRVPLTAIEVLWMNLIINQLAAVALLAETTPTKEQMEKPRPMGRNEPLITKTMWRNVLGQALYQIGVILALQFKGESVLGLSQKVNDSLVYNTFVLCQVANQFNAHCLGRKNVFDIIRRNKLFLVVVGTTIILQVVMVEFLKRFANTERLEWGQWAACAGIAASSWPIDLLINFISVPEVSFAILFHP